MRYLDEELNIEYNNIYLSEGQHLYKLYINDAQPFADYNLVFEGSIYATAAGTQDLNIYVGDIVNDYRYINKLDSTYKAIQDYRVNVVCYLYEDDETYYESKIQDLKLVYRYPRKMDALYVSEGVMLQGYGKPTALMPRVPYCSNYSVQPLFSITNEGEVEQYYLKCGPNTTTPILTGDSTVQLYATVGQLTQQEDYDELDPNGWTKTEGQYVTIDDEQTTTTSKIYRLIPNGVAVTDTLCQIYADVPGEGLELIKDITGDDELEVTIPASINGKKISSIVVCYPEGFSGTVRFICTYDLSSVDNTNGYYKLTVETEQPATTTSEQLFSLTLTNLKSCTGYPKDIYVYNGENHKIATIDYDCLAKYYLKWVDREGSFQSQPMNAFVKYSESIDTEMIQTYSGRNRKTNFQVTPKYTINTGWVSEKYIPYYESIFVSPYLKLYDTEEETEYDVILTDKNYTEEKYEYGKKLINLVFNVEVSRKQNLFA